MNLPGSLWGQASWQYGAGTISAPSGVKVGIGTTNPQAALEVAGNLLLGGSQVGQGTLYSSQNQTLSIVSGNVGSAAMIFGSGTLASPIERMRIDGASGNVGIWTATPGALLEASGVIRTTGQFGTPTSGSGVEMVFNGTGYVSTATRTAGGAVSAWLPLHVNGGVLSLQTDSGGNVGIGTTAPQHKLSVNGTIGTREVIATKHRVGRLCVPPKPSPPFLDGSRVAH